MHFLLAALLAGCLALIQCLIGGTRLAFSLPAYALVALAAVLSAFWIRRPMARPDRACLVSTLLLAGYTFLRAWFSPVDYLARTDLFMIAGALIVYLLTVLYLPDSRWRLWIVAVLLAVGCAHLVVGFIQFHYENGFLPFGFLRGDITPRASGMLISGNHLAGYLEAIGLVALSITIWSRCSLPVKMLTGYFAVFCYLGVAVSGSRGGYLSTLISLVAFGMLSIWVTGIYRRQARLYFILGTCIAGAGLLAVAGSAMRANSFTHKRLQVLAQSSKDVRVYNWLATLDQFRLAPVWGTGAGTHLYYGRLFRRPQIQNDPIHSHGDYLELLAEYGIVGEVLAAAFLLTHLGCALRSLHALAVRRLANTLVSARSNALALILSAAAAVIALMAHSVVDFNMHIPANALLFAFLFGILGNPGIDHPAPGESPALPDLLMRGLLPLLGLGMLAGALLKYPGEKLTEQSRVALRDHDYGACLQQADAAIKADPSNPHPYFYQGEAYRLSAAGMKVEVLRSALFEKAVTAFRKGLERFPQDENLLVRLGQALDGARRFDQAEEAYQSAIRWDPNLGVLYAYYAGHLQQEGKTDAAAKCVETAKRFGVDTRDFDLKKLEPVIDADPTGAGQE